MISDDTNIDSELTVYQKLNETDSNNKYEYILPKIELTKTIENKTKLNGNFEFETNNYIHNYQTNIYDRVNTNNLIFKSNPTITKMDIIIIMNLSLKIQIQIHKIQN